ncbi:DUF1127 domain-containing protein [Methylobacterium sp. J-068]|uniref:DUF1127 domain-containing protein n=1 Tax=Methylobacterium sp. J-068 TaxID=2836649 RepID=UPI001FB97637|nr:DUF1127 domain-containing protein [Methylobacterium sp. J-068]MCJ2035292.1 DUF1127 domain-containing protein [Methylobacterium sp. J-068]
MDAITPSTTESNSTGAGRAVLARAKARLKRWMAAAAEGMSRAAINRRVVRQLSAMSDRELKDIGLVRQDVLDSETLLLEGDASSFLIGRREERRSGRRIPTGQWPPRSPADQWPPRTR